MWTLDEIGIEIEQVEGSTMVVQVTTPAGRIDILGEVYTKEGVLHIDGAHVQGLEPGALSRAGLNAIGRKLIAEADVQEIVITGSARTTGRYKGRVPSPIRFPR